MLCSPQWVCGDRSDECGCAFWLCPVGAGMCHLYAGKTRIHGAVLVCDRRRCVVVGLHPQGPAVESLGIQVESSKRKTERVCCTLRAFYTFEKGLQSWARL